MNSNFINIGNQIFVDARKIKYIVSADSNRVARLLGKYGIKRDDIRVFDASSNKETRSFLVLDDGTFGITSVSAKVLCDRANGAEKVVKEENGKKKVVDEKDASTKKFSFRDLDNDGHWVHVTNTHTFEE